MGAEARAMICGACGCGTGAPAEPACGTGIDRGPSGWRPGPGPKPGLDPGVPKSTFMPGTVTVGGGSRGSAAGAAMAPSRPMVTVDTLRTPDGSSVVVNVACAMGWLGAAPPFSDSSLPISFESALANCLPPGSVGWILLGRASDVPLSLREPERMAFAAPLEDQGVYIRINGNEEDRKSVV